ncbi:hypothetical protein BASA83_011882 [Batrachochytrium salamandrivorans]|nr:hypothetical protein BASA83_011882 [Batrachochytrium salamandrivorans]
MKVSFVSILTTAALFISTVQCTGYSLWSAERRSGRVVFLPYTQQQRESVMGNVDRMMKMWVSSDSKQIHYDGKANPYPDLDTFRETYAGMTDEQFNLDLTRIFNKIRDSHTVFYKAGPYGCFSVSTGLHFQFVDNSIGSSEPPKVRVVRITNTPEIRGLIWKVLSTVAVGDELLTVNGLSFHDHYFSAKAFGGNQELYTVTVPYVALSNDECWSLSSSLYEELNSIAPPEIPASTSFKQKRSVLANDTSLLENNTLHRRDTDIHKRSYSESVYFEDTSIDGLFWTIWRNGERRMGVIKIESFNLVLDGTNKDTTFLFLALAIRDLLVKQLKYTDSILFDLRGNDGGLIPAADGIIQLFKSDVTASQFRYLKNDATESLFYKGLNSNNPWSKAWDATSDTSRYSGFGSMEDSSILNTLGQAYFNPVGVYTNGICYSACETFAAQIQDHGIGTVFGEDEATDPFTKKLTGENSGQKFYTRVTVSVRQLVRGGKYAGQLVEDNGVKSDVIVRPTIDDILPGYKSVSAYDRIADYLGDVAKRKVDKNIYFISEPYNRATFEDSIDIPFVVSGVDEIIVVHQGENSWKVGKEITSFTPKACDYNQNSDRTA